jgi:hypothetical protein
MQDPSSTKINLSHSTPDKNGYVPDHSLRGRRLRHTGNGKVYVIFGFAWLGDGDVWGYLHFAEQEMGPVICRPVDHLEGHRSDGAPRYEVLL